MERHDCGGLGRNCGEKGLPAYQREADRIYGGRRSPMDNMFLTCKVSWLQDFTTRLSPTFNACHMLLPRAQDENTAWSRGLTPAQSITFCPSPPLPSGQRLPDSSSAS
ncbi:hypothetical protein Bbelb_105150 [Branchiostoma belcheri]|nr:hypothetical protein Bbelb_105150 [Branchiostoma belcheri]